VLVLRHFLSELDRLLTCSSILHRASALSTRTADPDRQTDRQTQVGAGRGI